MRRVFAATRNLMVLFAVAAVVPLPAAQAQGSGTPGPPKLRLADDVVGPIRYAVDLAVVPDHDSFTGAVDIELSFKKPSSVLWLNAEKLQVKEATLSVGGQGVPLKVIPTPKDYVGFAFDHAVGPTEAALHVVYQGEISRKDEQGIFQVKDSDQWYVYTQFEAIAARRAFPCFDEPSYKVPWQLTLHVKKGMVALSNTPALSEVDTGDGMKTVKFAETKPLPSYLVALTVGDMEFVDAGTAGKKSIPVRIVVPHGRRAEAKYAAETTPAIVNLLETYFGVPYPYDKFDEVAVPEFGNAMENAGLVTYGASMVLWTPAEDTPQRQRGWVSVASHELSHQWFGDLVTTSWWNDLWLNEGFASWMGNKIVGEYHPEWKTHISELGGYRGAMWSDQLVSARKVRQPIESNDDIANAFDSTTYQKGAALLNMFESYMGPEKFRDGVRRYLGKYAWGNTTAAQFLAALAGEDNSVVSAFSSFLDQPGVPLVSIGLYCNGGAARLNLSQQRFLPLASKGSADQTWGVPVCVRYPGGEGDARECTLLQQASGQMTLSKAKGCPAWVDANAGAAGYYLTSYQGDLLDRLVEDDARVLTPREKIALIDDVNQLVRGGQIGFGKALALVPNLARDRERQVVTNTMEIATGLENEFVRQDLLPRYRQYLLDIYGGRARTLGWKARSGESDDDRLLRPRVLNVVANEAEDPELIAQGKKLALAWLEDHSAVDPDMVWTVLSIAARHGDRDLFGRLRAAARQEKGEDFRRALLWSLGSFRDPEIPNSAFPIALTDEFDSRESIDILWAARGSPKSRDLVYGFIKQNWDGLVAKLPTDYGADLAWFGGGCDAERRRDADAFFKDRSTKYTGGPRVLAQMLEQSDLCVAHKKIWEPSITEFLEHYGNKH